MASKATFSYGITAQNTYITITAEAGTVWNGSALESILAANWSTYALAMAEADTTGIYQATIPATLPAGIYEPESTFSILRCRPRNGLERVILVRNNYIAISNDFIFLINNKCFNINCFNQ